MVSLGSGFVLTLLLLGVTNAGQRALDQSLIFPRVAFERETRFFLIEVWLRAPRVIVLG